jgi:O-antigen ligase
MNLVAARSRSQINASSRFLDTVDAVRTVSFIGGCGLLFWQYDLAPVDWLFGIGIVGSIVLWLRGRQGFDLAWPQPLLAAFLGVTAVVTAVAGGSSGFLVTTIFLILSSLAFTSVLRANERRRRATEMAIMVGGALTVATIILAVVSRQFEWTFLDFLNRDYLRSQGLFKDPNVAGGFVAIVYPLAAAWAIRRGRFRMRLLLLVTAAFGFGVVFSWSRMALLMFVIGFLGVAIALWVLRERRLLAALVGVTLASVVLIVAVVGIDNVPLYRYEPVQGYDENGRLVVWGFALQMFREAPLGTGDGSFEGRSLARFASIVDPPAAAVPAAVVAPVTGSESLPGFHSQWVAQSAYPTIRAGEPSATIVISLRNTGTATWTKGTSAQAALDVSASGLLVGNPSQPVAALPGLIDLSRTTMGIRWPTAQRVAVQDEQTVAPGQVGRFIFQVRAPQTAGTYVLPLHPVVDAVGALEDEGIFVRIAVTGYPSERGSLQGPPANIDAVPVAAPGGYSLPAGAVRVADSSALISALEDSSPRDIVLADGVYDNSTPFYNVTGHRLYAATLGGAVLRAGISMGGNWGAGGGLLRGLTFDVSDPAKTLGNSIVSVWGSGVGTRILDTTINGNGVVGSAVVARQVEALVLERVQVRNVTESGIMVDANAPGLIVATSPLLKDVDVAGVGSGPQAAAAGRAEPCLSLGNTVAVQGAKLRSCWAGLWIRGNVGSSFERVDIDAARFGLYLDRGTKSATFRDLRLGSTVVGGLQATAAAMVGTDSTGPSGASEPNGSLPPVAATPAPLTVTPSAHNFYLRLAVETGAIGFIALLAYLGFLLWSAIKRSSRVSWQWPLAFALVLIAGLTIDTVHWRGLWIYVAVIAATIGPQKAARGRRAWPQRRHAKVDRHSRKVDHAPAEQDPAPTPATRPSVATTDPAILRGRTLMRNRAAARGPVHPDVAEATHELASIYHDHGDHHEAESLYLDALRIYEATLPGDSPTLVWLLEDLADLRRDQGRDEEAAAIYRRALVILATTRAPDDPVLAQKRAEYRLPT